MGWKYKSESKETKVMSLSDIEKEFFTRFNVPKTCCRKYLTACTRYGECPECSHYDQNFSQCLKK